MKAEQWLLKDALLQSQKNTFVFINLFLYEWTIFQRSSTLKLHKKRQFSHIYTFELKKEIMFWYLTSTQTAMEVDSTTLQQIYICRLSNKTTITKLLYTIPNTISINIVIWCTINALTLCTTVVLWFCAKTTIWFHLPVTEKDTQRNQSLLWTQTITDRSCEIIHINDCGECK